MTILDDIKTHLESDGVAGLSTGWDIFLGIIPEEIDTCVAVFETAGEAPEADAGATGSIPSYDFPGLQVRVRGDPRGYQAARDKMQEVFNSLHESSISNFNYVYANSTPFLLEYDENSRPSIALNLICMRERD